MRKTEIDVLAAGSTVMVFSESHRTRVGISAMG